MYTLSAIVVTGLVSLLAGSILGFLLSGNLGGRKRSHETEERLARAEETLVEYQRDVAQHFAQTTELVNTLTESYRDMHEHLAHGALTLSTPEISRQLLSPDNQPPGTVTADTSEAILAVGVQAPRDWAPKKQGQEGALSEGYGLKGEERPLAEDNPPEPSPETPVS